MIRRSVWERAGGISLYSGLILLGVTVNLIAFALSLLIPAWATEANPYVQPGSLLSLARSETIIILGSLLCRLLCKDRMMLNMLQAAIVALLTGDASNDVLLMISGREFLAIVGSYALTAFIPTLVAIKFLGSHRRGA
jgi:hypothetical protein